MRTSVSEVEVSFVLALADGPNHSELAEAWSLADDIRQSYDPITQTSTVPAYAGTNATVCHNGTGWVTNPDSEYLTDDA